MVRITFSSESTSRLVVCEPSLIGKATLLAIARRAGVPLLFNCEAGGCGACLVEVRVIDGHAGSAAALTDEEQLYLRARGGDGLGGYCRENDRSGGASPGSSVRLACQYVLGPHDLEVRFRTVLGA